MSEAELLEIVRREKLEYSHGNYAAVEKQINQDFDAKIWNESSQVQAALNYAAAFSEETAEAIAQDEWAQEHITELIPGIQIFQP